MPDHFLLKRWRKAVLRERRAWERVSRAEEAEEAALSRASHILSRFRGAKDEEDVFNRYHSMEGRALCAEAVLVELQKTQPEAVLAARITVCGPGTYYPLTQPEKASA